ncbi:MAG: hypothetical protein MUF31_00505 [Akkermansiaceae bacterium]|nr:hypothetical protein [Akkermansiaceae bacterium]
MLSFARGGCGWKPLEIREIAGKQEPRRLWERAGFRKEIGLLIRFLNYLSAWMESKYPSSRLWVLSGLYPIMDGSMPATTRHSSDPMAG